MPERDPRAQHETYRRRVRRTTVAGALCAFVFALGVVTFAGAPQPGTSASSGSSASTSQVVDATGGSGGAGTTSPSAAPSTASSVAPVQSATS